MSCVSHVVEDPRYSIDRRISVVMTRHEASGLIVVSPVIRPASHRGTASSIAFLTAAVDKSSVVPDDLLHSHGCDIARTQPNKVNSCKAARGLRRPPTSRNSSASSRYFWLLSALSGDV